MRVSNTTIGLGTILFGIWVIAYSLDFPKLEQNYPGPSLFPTVLTVLFIFVGIALIVKDLRSGAKKLKFDISGLSRGHIINILLTLSAILFYIFPFWIPYSTIFKLKQFCIHPKRAILTTVFGLHFQIHRKIEP